MTANNILFEHAERILEQARRQGRESLKLLGGLAIRKLFSEMAQYPTLQRTSKDIDFAVSKKDAKGLGSVFEGAGFTADRQFNALHGETRLIYSAGAVQVDIFVGVFEQCHKLHLEPRLRILPDTLPPADLLLMKLQVVEINEKDLQDLCVLLLGAEIGQKDSNQTIHLGYITGVTSSDWGWYTTCWDTLDKVLHYAKTQLDSTLAETLAEKVNVIREALEKSPKNLKWKMRNTIGRKVQWYELPEETKR